MNDEKKLNGNENFFLICIKFQINIFFSLRIELQDAEADDLAGSKDITKDSRRRQR